MADDTTKMDPELEVCESCRGSGNVALGGYCDLCHNEGTVKPEVNKVYRERRGY